jgi:maltose/maltodextrin transport system permease protein
VTFSRVLVALIALPALYFTFLLYQTGNPWFALLLLIATAVGFFVYSSKSTYAYRYLFPGLLGFGLFVIFPLLYTVYISFTKYSSQHLLSIDRCVAALLDERFTSGTGTFSYTLYRQDDGEYILLLRDKKDPNRAFVSSPFVLKPNLTAEKPPPLEPLPPGQQPPGKPLGFEQVMRERLFMQMRGFRASLPDQTLLSLESLQDFTAHERLWVLNKDGTLTNRKDGTVIRPDFQRGFFVNDKGDQVGPGFRTMTGWDNYLQILTDPRIQVPFLRIFIWNVAFAGLSVLGSFAAGLLLAVVLDWKELHFRKVYRLLLILPYAVPGILSILILKGMFNQEFGIVNAILRGIFGVAPEWETNPWGARAMILIVNIWLGYPYMMLVCTGMLQSIPHEIFEASAIEGGTPSTNLFKITLPLILPAIVPLLIGSFAYAFNNFVVIYLLTSGGPTMVGAGIAGETDILVSYTFRLAFRDTGQNYGLASAIATVIFMIVATLAWVNLRANRAHFKI